MTDWTSQEYQRQQHLNRALYHLNVGEITKEHFDKLVSGEEQEIFPEPLPPLITEFAPTDVGRWDAVCNGGIVKDTTP